MRNIYKALLIFLFVSIVACKNSGTKEEEIVSETHSDLKDTIFLSNKSAKLAVATQGGAFVDFHFVNQNINPLNWRLKQSWVPKNNQSGAPFRGQFLCLGRWGSPTDGEIAAGIPHNGEQNRDYWEIEEQKDGFVKMSFKGELDGFYTNRSIKLDEKSAAFLVEENVKNINSIGRINNVVQHVTLGPPFLTRDVIVNSNSWKGFNQEDNYPLEDSAFTWPEGRNKDLMMDATSTDTDEGYCVSYLVQPESEYGWISAFNPKQGLVIGYLWERKEYPWINIWNHVEEGIPLSKGIEFGTGGMGRDYKELLENDSKFFGENSFEWIDAGETKNKSFICFLNAKRIELRGN